MTTSTHICLGGLRDSIALLHATNDTIDGGAAVGAAAFWASALDEQLRAADTTYDFRRDRDTRGQLLPGIRLVRNAVTHGAVVTVEQAPGMPVPNRVPFTTTHLAYRPLEHLLADWVGSRHRGSEVARQNSAYRKYLAGRPVLDPMVDAFEWFIAESGLTIEDFPWRC